MPQRRRPYNPGMTLQPYLDTFPQLADGVFVHQSAQIIGDVNVARDASIWCNAVVRGDVNRITIGEGSNVQDFAMCHVSHRSAAKPEGAALTIGKYVTIAHSVLLHGCTIGDECLVGMGSIIMDDVVIEKHVMVGAGSLVAPGKVLKSGGLYVGRPAMRIRELTEQEVAHFRYSAEHYMRLKNNYLAQKA